MQNANAKLQEETICSAKDAQFDANVLLQILTDELNLSLAILM